MVSKICCNGSMLNELEECVKKMKRQSIIRSKWARSVNKIVKELHLVPGWVLILEGHRRFISELLWCKLGRRGP